MSAEQKEEKAPKLKEGEPLALRVSDQIEQPEHQHKLKRKGDKKEKRKEKDLSICIGYK